MHTNELLYAQHFAASSVDICQYFHFEVFNLSDVCVHTADLALLMMMLVGDDLIPEPCPLEHESVKVPPCANGQPTSEAEQLEECDQWSSSHTRRCRKLSVFTKNNVNMTRIQSSPSKFTSGEKRQVDFYIDIEGTLTDRAVVTAISRLF